jgi:hypothetical protein
MFYFNWGWGGSQNGYFYVSNLSPQILFPNSNQAIRRLFPPNILPDLVIQNLSVTPSSVTAGSSITVTYRLKNQGIYYAGPSKTRIYYSLDNAYSSDDYEIGSQDEGELGAGNYVNRTKTLTIPSFATSGTRYIIVYADKDNTVLESNETNQTQSFAITVQTSCLNCPSYDFSINPATTWQTHSSSHPANGCKMYRISVTPGYEYTFKTGCGDGATANYDTYLELFNTSCNIIISNDDGCESSRSKITWTATSSGYVYLRVKGFSGAGGSYTLAYNYVNQVAPCLNCPSYDFSVSSSTSWQTHSSSHGTNGCKVYRISFSQGNQYSFKTGCGDNATANYDTYLELFNSGCAIVASNDDGCESNRSLITWTATYSGYGYLKVRGYNGVGGSYTLAYMHAVQSGSCLNCPSYDFTLSPSSSWQTHSSSHGTNGCKVYRVAVSANKSYTFKTGCGNNATANYDTYLELFNSSCSIVASNDDGCESNRSKISWTSSYAGYAYLKVRGYNGAGGSYTLAYNYISLKEGSPEIEVSDDYCMIYPNPVNNSFTIGLSESNVIRDIAIFNSFGLQVKYKKPSEENNILLFQCSELQPGPYLIRVNAGSGTFIRKLTIIR